MRTLPLLFLAGFFTLPQLHAEGEFATTPEGVPVKVIVSSDTAIYAKPDPASRSRPVKTFQFFYVLPQEDAAEGERTKDGYYRIASASGAELGWISAEDVVEWPHRQALGLRPKTGRVSPALFFSDKGAVEGAYGGGDAKPFSKEPEGAVGFTLAPILSEFTMKADGDDVSGYEIAYLHGAGKSGGGAGSESVDLAKSTLDIVFVIDTTASMQPWIDATKTVVEQIAKDVADSAVEVRLGLVGYRDVVNDPPPGWYVTKVYCNLEDGADLETFSERLDGVVRAEEGSEDFPEDVLAGLNEAIDPGGENIGWNPDAFKHIILIGDASAQIGTATHKNRDKQTIEGIVASAQPAGGEATIKQKIAIHSVRIVGEESSDHDVCEKHFKMIAQGEEVAGQYHEFDGKDEAPEFIETLAGALSKGLKGLDEVKKGRMPAPDTPALGLLLQMAEASETPTDVPTFASGFACELDAEGNQQFEPWVLVSYSRLSMCEAAIDFIIKAMEQAGEPGDRDAKKFLKSLQLLSINLNMDEDFTEDTDLQKVLSYALGIPVQNRIFSKTPKALLNMTAEDYNSWVAAVNASRAIMKGNIDNAKIWQALTDEDTDLKNRVAFIRVKDLP